MFWDENMQCCPMSACLATAYPKQHLTRTQGDRPAHPGSQKLQPCQGWYHPGRLHQATAALHPRVPWYDCTHTLHRYGQWHMIARILYTGTDSPGKTLAHDCTHILHRYGQYRKYIGTWLHAYSTKVRAALSRHCHVIVSILYTGTDSPGKTLTHDCRHTLHR